MRQCLYFCTFVKQVTNLKGQTEDSNVASEEELRCVSICTFVLAEARQRMYFCTSRGVSVLVLLYEPQLASIPMPLAKN